MPQFDQGAGGRFFTVFASKAGRIANGIAVSFVILLAAVFAYEVTARTLFNSPTGYANQLAAYGMPFITYLAAARTLEMGAHVNVDAFVTRLSERRRMQLEVVMEALSVILIAALTVIGLLVVRESWESGYKAFSTSVTFPEFIPQMVMPLGLAVLCLQQAERFFASVRRLNAASTGGNRA